MIFKCFLEENREKIVWLDQDVLNIVFADDKKLLEQQVYNFTFFSDTLFSKDELEKIAEKNSNYWFSLRKTSIFRKFFHCIAMFLLNFRS